MRNVLLSALVICTICAAAQRGKRTSMLVLTDNDFRTESFSSNREASRALDVSIKQTRGPEVIVESPDHRKVSAPFPVLLRFLPKQGRPVAFRTVQILVSKCIAVGCFGSVNALQHVTPEFTDNTMSFTADIPPGTYKIKMSVDDTSGNTSIGEVVITVIRKHTASTVHETYSPTMRQESWH